MFYWIHKIEDENVDPVTSWLPVQLESPVNGANTKVPFEEIEKGPEICRILLTTSLS